MDVADPKLRDIWPLFLRPVLGVIGRAKPGTLALTGRYLRRPPRDGLGACRSLPPSLVRLCPPLHACRQQVRADVIKSLRLKNPATFIQSFNRTNLFFRVEDKPDKALDAMKYVAEFIARQNQAHENRQARATECSGCGSGVIDSCAFSRAFSHCFGDVSTEVPAWLVSIHGPCLRLRLASSIE